MFLLKAKAPANLTDMTFYIRADNYDDAYKSANTKHLNELGLAAEKYNTTTLELERCYKGAALG